VLSRFSVRFVLAVFGGAAVGLLVGVLGRYLLHTNWNVFAAMPWGILVAALVLASRSRRSSQPDRETGEPTEPTRS
jgi:hypothetical protein